MEIKYLGTAASEGIPALFCDCETCRRSMKLGGKNIRTRSQAIIDNSLLIDFPADTYMHFLKHKIPMTKIKTCIITHSHEDHLYPDEIIMRKTDCFAHVDSGEALTFYCTESGYNMICKVTEKNHIPDRDVRVKKIEPFEAFETEGYKITPMRAIHDPKSSPVIFAIEKDGKSIFYANDTAQICEETMDCLKKFKKPFNVVSFDCTWANNPDYDGGHMNFKQNIEFRDEFIKCGIANKDTVFITNHFSHNSKDVVYDDFLKIANEYGFTVAYDGMEIKF